MFLVFPVFAAADKLRSTFADSNQELTVTQVL